MTKRWSLYLFATLITASQVSIVANVHAEQTTPNVVFLLADDLGWTGLRCFGSDFYETANLDRLAQTGMKFTDAYSACTVCSPTRASIMTGMYPARLRLTDFIAGQNRPYAKLTIPQWTKGLEDRHVTIAEALREAGYATAQVGKWHLDFPSQNRAGQNPVEQNPLEQGPTGHGFDAQFMKPSGTRGYFIGKGTVRQRDPENHVQSEYLTDYLTDKAVEFIDSHHDQPFFLYFAYHTPHTPIQGRPDLVAEFEKKVRDEATHNNPHYAAMVASLDQSVGRVLARLEKHRIAEKTLVIFTSDNGGLTQRNGKHDGFTENLPLRRGKGSAYEGGVRVPTIVRLPQVTQAGSVCDEPVMSIDFYPTLLEITGAKGSEHHNQAVDGRSLVPLLRDAGAELDRNLYWHYPHYHAGGDSPYSAIRSRNWRLIEFHEDQRVELYDLSKDVGEMTDLAAQLPATAEELKHELHLWRDSVEAQMPTSNPNHDTDRATEVQRR